MSSREPVRPQAAPAPSDRELSLSKGASIGRYIILGPLGRGGMGEVYAAYDPELNRKIAIKLLRARGGASTVDGHTRLLREAQAIARLSHPNVVVVYDVGTFQETVFIAMEFVEGHTLGYWLQAKQRSWREVIDVFLLAGRGLAAAHAAGLVHRDFKPDNVMITKGGEVRVMDFGLAREEKRDEAAAPVVRPLDAAARAAAVATTIAPEVDPDTTMKLDGGGAPGGAPAAGATSASGYLRLKLTETGALLGTPAYMAPEQFAGTGGDARTDQFSFSVALYEGLYGRRPFAGTDVAAVMANVMGGKLTEAPDNSQVPGWIRKVLLRGLSTRLDDRFPSMAELLATLSRDPAARQRRWLAALAAVGALVALGMGIHRLSANQRTVCAGGAARAATAWGFEQRKGIEKAFSSSGHRRAAQTFATMAGVLDGYVARWTGMYTEACEATQVRGEQSAEVLDLRMECLSERLSGLRALATVFQTADTGVVENAVSAANALGSLDRCADIPLLRAIVRPPEDPATRAKVAELRRRLADLKAFADAGRFKEVLKPVQSAAAEARAIGYQPLLAEILLLQGQVLGYSNDVKVAEKALVEAFWAADASRVDEVRATAATELVFVFGYQENEFEEAERWSGTADAVLQRVGGHELLRAWQQNNIGVVRGRFGQRAAALRALQEALALKEKALGRDHPDVGMTEGNIAVELEALERNQEALAHADRAVTLVENGLGSSHPELATLLNNRGEILDALGRRREARQSFERARVIWERELGLDDRNLAYALTGIGLSYLAEDDASSALAPLERAYKIREAHELDPSRRAETRFALARSLWETNRDRARARALAEQAREAYTKGDAKAKVVEVDGWLRARGGAS